MSNARVLGHVVDERVYVVTITPPMAKDLLFVSSYDSEDPLSNAVNHHGYQRPPSRNRFAEIGAYFAEGNHRELITPIIVSVRLDDPSEIERFLKLLNSGDVKGIKKAFGEKIASIVDGQHRLYGLAHAWEKDNEFLPEIPVVLYFGLTFIEEAELFNTINVTQRKLPKALIETTRGDITESGDPGYAQKIRRLTFSLCRDDDSVWGPRKDGTEQINMTGIRDPDRPVSYEGLRRSTGNMYPKELLDRLDSIDEGLALKYAKRYWGLVSEACAEAWNGIPATRIEVDADTGTKHEVPIKYRIKDLVGVAALAKLGKDIVTSQLESRNDPKKMELLVEKLTEVDWEKRPGNPWMASQAGFAGQKDLYLVLHAWVYSDKAPGVAANEGMEDSEAA